jgi:quercetin dioxygenase-like cupin family protein
MVFLVDSQGRHILDGEAVVMIAGKASKMSPGDVIILPAGEVHSIRATRNFKMLLVMIRAS